MFVEPSLADKLAKDGTYHKWMLAQVKSGNKDALKVFFLNFVFYQPQAESYSAVRWTCYLKKVCSSKGLFF